MPVGSECEACFASGRSAKLALPVGGVRGLPCQCARSARLALPVRYTECKACLANGRSARLALPVGGVQGLPCQWRLLAPCTNKRSLATSFVSFALCISSRFKAVTLTCKRHSVASLQSLTTNSEDYTNLSPLLYASPQTLTTNSEDYTNTHQSQHKPFTTFIRTDRIYT